MKKIVVMGSTNTDMVITGRKIPVPGETVSGGTFLMNPGGKGANQAVNALKRLGVRQALVTMGAKGVYCGNCERLYPCRKVKAVDCVAAGDTFNGGFAVGLSEGMSCRDAIAFAQQAAAISVTRPGAQSSVPTRAEIQR